MYSATELKPGVSAAPQLALWYHSIKTKVSVVSAALQHALWCHSIKTICGCGIYILQRTIHCGIKTRVSVVSAAHQLAKLPSLSLQPTVTWYTLNLLPSASSSSSSKTLMRLMALIWKVDDAVGHNLHPLDVHHHHGHYSVTEDINRKGFTFGHCTNW